MPRTAREQSTTGIYHVMLRGINRQDIFEEPEDYMKIIKTLSSLTKMTETTPDGMRKKICTCHIYAYCHAKPCAPVDSGERMDFRTVC